MPVSRTMTVMITEVPTELRYQSGSFEVDSTSI